MSSSFQKNYDIITSLLAVVLGAFLLVLSLHSIISPANLDVGLTAKLIVAGLGLFAIIIGIIAFKEFKKKS